MQTPIFETNINEVKDIEFEKLIATQKVSM